MLRELSGATAVAPFSNREPSVTMSAAAAAAVLRQSIRAELPAAAGAGFWGETTATIDWCELNYERSFYVAEFWNTLSNLLFVLLGLYGLAQSAKQGFEWRFHACFIGIMVTGIGSAMFHGTLQHVCVGRLFVWIASLHLVTNSLCWSADTSSATRRQ